MTASHHRLLPGILSAVCVLLPSASQAGAWTQSSDDWLIINTATYYRSDRYFDHNGKRQSQEPFTKYELNPYIEYGYSDTLTLGGNFFLHYLDQQNTNSSYNYGLGDSELFARQQLWQRDGFVLSAQPLIKLPSVYKQDQLPRGGYTSMDAELSLLAGYSFEWNGQYHYLDGRLGYRHRFDNGMHDQYKADLRLGISLNESWQIIPAITTTFASDITPQQAFAESGSNDYDLLKLECNLLYRLNDKQYISVGGFSHADGTNSGEGYGLMIAAGTRF